MYHNKHNGGYHIKHVIDTTECTRHQVGVGAPCWSVYATSSGQDLTAICGSRIKKFGFDGKISPSSLSQKIPGGRTGKNSVKH